jgi:hypothetical protein
MFFELKLPFHESKGGFPMKITKISDVTSVFFGLLCLMALLNPTSVQAAASIPAVKGPIPVTAASYPFGAAFRTNAPQDLSQIGYVEEEYLVSGFANVYDFDADSKVVVKTPHAPYTTRILVRRPASPQKFSGTVVVELLNPTAMYDLDFQWQFANEYFIEHGDAWVGITSKPVTAQALKTFDPRRYAAVSWANPLPADQTCPNPVSFLPDSTPATENGLIWDIASQVGALLKSEAEHNPLKGFPVKMAFLTGYSQTGGYVVTYVNFIRPLPDALGPNGRPVYDGYLIGDGDGLLIPLNQCSAPIMPGDPRFIIKPRPEPVISVVSQVLWTGMGADRADSNSPKDRYRRYEIAGASHINMRAVSLWPKPEDMIKAGITAPPPNCTQFATYGMTDFPSEYFMRGTFANLDTWARSNIAPPKVRRIKVEPVPEGSKPTWPPSVPVKLDKYGNAVGGIRSPYLDVPTGTYYAHSTPANPDDPASGLFCSLVGYKVPFTKDLLMKLYPTHDRYVKKVNAQVDKLVRARLITPSDGQRIKNEAAQTTIP